MLSQGYSDPARPLPHVSYMVEPAPPLAHVFGQAATTTEPAHAAPAPLLPRSVHSVHQHLQDWPEVFASLMQDPAWGNEDLAHAAITPAPAATYSTAPPLIQTPQPASLPHAPATMPGYHQQPQQQEAGLYEHPMTSEVCAGLIWIRS